MCYIFGILKTQAFQVWWWIPPPYISTSTALYCSNTTKYKPVLLHTDSVLLYINQYRPILSQYHQVSISTALYYPSTTKYQRVPLHTDPVPPSTNQYRLLLTHYHHIFYSNVRLSFVDLRGAQLYVSLVCGFSLNCDLRVSIYSIQKGGGKAQDFQFFLNDNCDFYISIHFRHWSGNLYCCVCVVGLRSTLPLLHLETNFKCRWDHLSDLQKVFPDWM